MPRLDKPTRDPVDRPDSPTPAEPVRDALRQRLADLPPWHPSSPHPDRPEGRSLSFSDQIPRFEAVWKSHVARWPGKPANADRARHDDPPGSWRGRGNEYLNPEQHAEVGGLIADLQRPEKQITSLLMQIERDNSHGGVFAGLEHRLKGTDRLKEKIVDKAEGDLGIDLTGVASEDQRRDSVHVLSQRRGLCRRLLRDRQDAIELAGCHMFHSENHWLDDPEYKGVNTRWRTPEGYRFELQFHTTESFYAKENLTHDSYDRLRAPDSLRSEQRELHEYQRLVSGAIERPDRVHEIADIREPT